MPAPSKRLLVVQVAGLGWNLARGHGMRRIAHALELQPMSPCFPAVTCTAQAVFRTALPPAAAGMVCNGRFDRASCRVEFWGQSARLVRGRRVWERFRAAGGRVGMLFWQQSLGEEVDMVLSPAPVHKHHGGMIQDCYGLPADLYARLCRRLGRRFDLKSYWGPLASGRSSRWITDAVCALLSAPEETPDVLLAYLPHLDYVLQRQGPQGPGVPAALRETAEMLERLAAAALADRREVLVWGDYAITAARTALFPNRRLREEGLFRARQVGRRTYPDLYASRAFVLADHQIAHVYARSPADAQAARAALACLDGIAEITTPDPATDRESGDLVLTAAPGYWFAYPWWTEPREAPDYARHVDIHNKIGFDPCELFWGWPPPGVSLDPSRVRGTHGRADEPVCVGATLDALRGAASLQELAARLAAWLEP